MCHARSIINLTNGNLHSTVTGGMDENAFMSEKLMTIGRLSKAGGVKITTIRYYESIGLMSPPDRSESGQRRYGAEAVVRLSFIRHARDLGFPVSSIRKLMDMQTMPDQDCAAVDLIAREQLADVHKRLTQLKTLEAELKRMIACCEGGQVQTCRIISTLNYHGARQVRA